MAILIFLELGERNNHLKDGKYWYQAMNFYRLILTYTPPILIIPFYIGSFLYFIYLPDITYYALGIYFDMWFPILRTFWGYPILFIIFLIPIVSIALTWLLIFQSFYVLFIFVIGSYYPRDELLGFVTMYPAAATIIIFIFSKLMSSESNHSSAARVARSTDSSPSTASSREESPSESRTARAARSSAASSNKPKDLYFDNRRSPSKKNPPDEPAKKDSSQENPSKDISSEADDLYFDNRRKK